MKNIIIHNITNNQYLSFKSSQKHTLKKNEIKNPKLAFDIFENKVIKNTKQNKNQDKNEFYKEISRIYQSFQENNNIESANKNFKRLAERLVSLGNNDLAGVIYSKLLKLNPNNKNMQETCAHNAKKNAYRMQDWIHTLSRCCDLKNTYRNNPNKQEEFKKNLYETKNCLKKICSQYAEAKEHYKSINKPIRSIFVYKNMLGLVYSEIADYILKENPNEAKICLAKALEIFNEVQNIERINITKKLLSKIK